MAKQTLYRARRRKILFLDDLGKAKFTERVEMEFYDLIEFRAANKLPILFTANMSGKQLTEALGEDRGEPIMRRLREFCDIIGT